MRPRADGLRRPSWTPTAPASFARKWRRCSAADLARPPGGAETARGDRL